MRWLPACCLLVALFGSAAQAQNVERQRAQASKQLADVQAKIAQLAASQRELAARRDSLQGELAAQAKVVAAASLALRESEAQLALVRARLDELAKRRSALQSARDEQRAALAELLRSAYTLGRGSDLRWLLERLAPCEAAAGDAATDCHDGASVERAMAYARYLQRDRVTVIGQLGADLGELAEVEQAIDQQRRKLIESLAAHRARTTALDQARSRKAQLLAAAEAKLADQQDRMADLERDRQALEDLIAELRDVFADLDADLPAATPFADLRGKLPPPLAGPRQQHGEGLLIEAEPGSEVRAVAHGRVAYADWLRGYGMLLILDHGDGWMSLYGNNESLLHSVGEWVEAGEEIATSGRAEGGKAGLYFGMRHDGDPVAPGSWLAGGD